MDKINIINYVFLLGMILASKSFSNSSDTLVCDQKLFGCNYYYQGQYLELHKIKEIISTDSLAKHYNPWPFYGVAEIISITGSSLMIFGIGKSIWDHKIQWGIIGSGLGVGIVLPIPFHLLGEHKLKQAVNIYNIDKNK